MNYHISSQITNMISIAQTFELGCKMAAMQDDGRVDKHEDKVLKEICRCTERFIKDLEKIKNR